MQAAEALRDPDIVGLTADSRQVRPGYLFAALPGSRRDGRDFIDQAVERGAVAVLASPGTAVAPPVAVVCDPDPRRGLALMAARFYGRQPRTVAAITGTNGKTSVASFTRQIWAAAGHRAAAVGTLGVTGHWVLGSLRWWAIGVGNLFAVIAMGAWLWHSHPKLRHQFQGMEIQTKV